MSGGWKEASTVILTALKNVSKSSCNYNLLALERSLRSSFMPSGYVFPGGTTHKSDSSKEWPKLFTDFGIEVNTKIKEAPPIIKTQTGNIDKLLSLKITAIREAFEETGILLCVSKNDSHNSGWVSFKAFEDLSSWRSKVQKDASEFLNLCQTYRCCPDVNSLYLWSNWLTPTSMGKSRFDTAFFICCLREHPKAVADETEISKLSWQTPEELLRSCKNKEIWLPPPQIYETARLLKFSNISDLKNFSEKRSDQGCERWMPVRTITSNGSVSVLPGDSSYKANDYFSLTEADKVDLTNEEFRLKSEVLHRMEFMNKIETKIVIKSYSPTNDHVLPAEF